MSETYRYESIVRTLRGLIERGVLRPGDRMPLAESTATRFLLILVRSSLASGLVLLKSLNVRL